MPVARIGESVSYSDKLKEQAQLINKRRQQNLNVEIAQEEKNRQFRDQQLQTFYDFDVSGMSAEHIKAIGKLQANMANSLDPNSEDHYQNTQQLIADISFLNNAYNVASRHRDQRQSGTQQMVGLMTGEVEANPGEEFVNEGIDGLNNANALWDQGGFSGEINVGGSAGNRSMSGVPLVPNPDGGWMEGQGEVSFFENSLTNDSSPLYRPTIIASAPTLNKMAESAMSDEVLNGTNTEEVANLRWSTMSDSKKQRIAKEEYDRLKTEDTEPFETMTPEQKKAMGIDDESLRNTYRDRLQEGVDARGKQRVEPLFDVQKTTEGLTNLKEEIKIKVSDENFAGSVIAADYAKGLNIEDLKDADGNVVIPIEVTYLESGNVTRKETIDPSNPAYLQFIQAMGDGGMNEMFDRSGYVIASEGGADAQAEAKKAEAAKADAAGPSAQQIEVADLDQQRLDILEGTEGNEGIRAIEEKAKNLRQESIDSASDEVGFFGRLAGNESKSGIEARPITDFMSPAEKLNYNQAQKDLADIDAQLAAKSNQAPGGTDDQASQDPADQPIQTEPGGVYSSSQLEQNLEPWEKELLAGTRPDQTVKSGVAVKAKNFGNLRPNSANPYRSGVYEVSAAVLDDDGNVIKPANQYQNFSTYDEGLKGLIWDIKSKQHLDGLSSGAVGKGSNIIDVMKKYAPSSDKNNPAGYTDHIVNFVNEKLGLTGEEAFTSKSKASELPTELLVEAIISKEDISLYKDMRDRGYFEEDKISGIVGNINSETAKERRREISRA